MVKFWFQSGDLEKEILPLSGQVIIKFKRKPFKVIMGCGDMVILGIKSDQKSSDHHDIYDNFRFILKNWS